MQGIRVRALVREDPTCHRATKPVCHNYWACVPQLLKPACLEPVLRNKRKPHSPQLEKACAQQRRPKAAKNKKYIYINKINLYKKKDNVIDGANVLRRIYKMKCYKNSKTPNCCKTSIKAENNKLIKNNLCWMLVSEEKISLEENKKNIDSCENCEEFLLALLWTLEVILPLHQNSTLK